MNEKNQVYDYIVIGSGFGGSVSAMRLAEKGYDVLVIEKGKKYEADDFPKSNWNLRKYLWAPALKWFGFQKLSFFRELFVISGVGVGGGSLVYANTHLEPPDEFYENAAWASFRDWKETLKAHYREAKFMLGTTEVNKSYIADELLEEIASDLGREDTYHKVEVGVYFGDTSTPKDPYFNGLGPERLGCIECAGCMVGCRFNAKNTLDKNYLYFARKFGASVIAETNVEKVEWIPDEREYRIHTVSSTSWFAKNPKIYRTTGVVFSGGVLGTLDLLLKQKYKYQTLSDLSDTLGENIRTNSESLCGVGAAKQKLNHGVAISSVFSPDENTQVELVKYPDGSGAMYRLAIMAAGDGNAAFRTVKSFINAVLNPVKFFRTIFNFHLATNAVVLLIMQTLDNSMRMRWKNSLFGGGITLDNRQSGQKRVPAYIPSGQDVMHRFAAKSGGVAQNAIPEVLFNMATTAHILGGCPMGATIKEGVVDEQFRVHGYPNMFILDGSIVPANPGVNPSLTITALSEYAMSLVPEKEGNTHVSLFDQLANVSNKPVTFS